MAQTRPLPTLSRGFTRLGRFLAPYEMSPDPEEMQHESVDREKPLRVRGGCEPAHLSLALSRRLMRTRCAVVRILPRAVNHGWHHGAVRRGVATQLVGDQPAR